MEKFTFKCNNCGSQNIEFSVTEYNPDNSYELLAICNDCGQKEEIEPL